MEYLTSELAAQKWGISVRLVQRHCAEGRVEGARKFGGTWAIPAKASKPEDPRRKGGSAAQACPPPSGRQACGTSALLMPLLNTACVPGSCLRSIEAMQEGPQRELALAEYHYFRGEAQQAVQMLQPYLTSPDLSARLSACLIYAYANLSVGQIAHARYALVQVRALLEGMGPDTPAPLRAAGAFAASAGAVLLHLPLPKETPEQQAHKAAVLEQALDGACAVPLEIMEACCEGIALAQEYAAKGSALAVSDAGCAALFCKAALQASGLNVSINTKLMADRAHAEALNAKADALLAQYVPLADTLYEKMATQLRGEV